MRLQTAGDYLIGLYNVAVPLDLYRLGFRLLAQEQVSFPAGKAGNVLRGAFGSTLRKQFCRPQCSGAETCAFREECVYASIFEPRSGGRFSNRPRPFVFRAEHLDGRTIEAGDAFEFDMNLFNSSEMVREQVRMAFAGLDSLGARRGAVKLLDMASEFLSVDLSAGTEPVQEVEIVFRTPTELKDRNEVASRPEFQILYTRAAERVSAFSQPAVSVESCPEVRLVHCSLTSSYVERRSSRTGQRHRLGGFTGEAVYQGDLCRCLPLLRAAEYTGVGRHASWGNGRIEIRRSA